jgi:hypothetical protein
MRILAHETLLTLITSFYLNETRSPSPPFLMNLSLGRFQNYPLNFAWHLHPPEPVVTSTSEFTASLFWNVSPKSNLIINSSAEMISDKTAVPPLSTLPSNSSSLRSLSGVAEQLSLPTSSKPSLLFVSKPILDFYWNTTLKWSMVTEKSERGAATGFLDSTLILTPLGTSSLGIMSNLAQPLLLNSSLGWSQDSTWACTLHLHTPKPIVMAICDSSTAFFWNVTPEKFLLIHNNDVMPTKTGDASLPPIPPQN